MQHYDLAVDLDLEEARLHGTATIRLRNASDQPADHVPLLLYRLMRVGSVRDDDGRPVDFTQRVETFEDQDRLQVNYVEIHPPALLAPGEETTVVVDWSGYLFGYTETGMLYVRERIDPAYTLLRPDAYAFPWLGYPHAGVDRSAPLHEFDHDIRITVPESLSVASGGHLVGVEREDGRATYAYRSIRPSWRIDVAVAPFEVLQQDGVRVFFLSEDRAGAEAVMRGFRHAVATFTAWFGPLGDFEGFNIIELPPGFGSQTDVTCILQTADAFRSADRVNELYHEASHLWNVTLTDLPSPRWEEGLASFLERLVIDVDAGDAALGEVERAADRVRERLRDRFAAEPRLAEIPMIDFGREHRTDLSYGVGLLMFAVLYHRVGPEEFNQVVGGFFQRYQATGASTEQFVAYADEVTRADLGPFFQDWLYGTGYTRFLDSKQALAEIAATYE